jgi:hypothetical protein
LREQLASGGEVLLDTCHLGLLLGCLLHETRGALRRRVITSEASPPSESLVLDLAEIFRLRREHSGVESEVESLQCILIAVAVAHALDRPEAPGPMCSIGS